MQNSENNVFVYILTISLLNIIAYFFYSKNPARKIKHLDTSVRYFRNFFFLMSSSFVAYGLSLPNPNVYQALFSNTSFLLAFYCLLYGFASRQRSDFIPIWRNKYVIANWIILVTINVGLFTIAFDIPYARAGLLALNCFVIALYTLKFIKRENVPSYGETVAQFSVYSMLVAGVVLIASLAFNLDRYTYLSVLMVSQAVVTLIVLGSSLVMFLSDVSDLYYKDSIMDELTGLFNRRFFWQQTRFMMKSAERHKFPISIIITDIDHFKQVNDIYGHQVGDKVLSEFAGVISSTIRDSDIAARYGGEEFITLLPQTCSEGAQILAERMRKETEKMRFTDITDCQPITASFGVVTFKDGESIEQQINDADKALYEAKSLGRNRVVVSQ
jgi:diguanylate cyclase (GGDEF)-like protein